MHTNTKSLTLTFFPYKWQRPCEDIHEVRQPVWVLHSIELTNVHHIVLILEDCSCTPRYTCFQSHTYCVCVHVNVYVQCTCTCILYTICTCTYMYMYTVHCKTNILIRRAIHSRKILVYTKKNLHAHVYNCSRRLQHTASEWQWQ